MGTAGDHFADVCTPLLQEQLGETVTYFPVAGAARSVTAIVEHMTRREQAAEVDAETDRITVNVLRHEDDAAGGVASPAVGDSVLRSGESDRYAFTGERLASSADTWTLVFERPRPRRLGTSFERR